MSGNVNDSCRKFTESRINSAEICGALIILRFFIKKKKIRNESSNAGICNTSKTENLTRLSTNLLSSNILTSEAFMIAMIKTQSKRNCIYNTNELNETCHDFLYRLGFIFLMNLPEIFHA